MYAADDDGGQAICSISQVIQMFVPLDSDLLCAGVRTLAMENYSQEINSNFQAVMNNKEFTLKT